MEASYLSTTKQVLEHFQVTSKSGLSLEQVEISKKKYGKNALPEDEKTPLWKMILEQFQDQLVIILMVAAVVSFLLAFFEEKEEVEGQFISTAYVEPIVILLILIGNATVGVVQETNAEQAIEALKKYSPDEAKVLRNGHLHRVSAEDLVPGDIIEISIGDKVPADCRMLDISSSSFRVDQSILTGESISVSKDTNPIEDPNAVKQDMTNIIFSGTTISTGKARAIVVQTGSNTAIGDIHKSIMNETGEKSPLKQKLDDFGDSLAKVISVICILVWLININHFNDPMHHGWVKGAVYYFKIAVALAVAAIPEGLAVVITTCLALGTKKMAAKNAIVRSLPSVETLGCTSVICSDKTGTLTTNQMSVQSVLLISDAKGAVEEYEVSGSSYAPVGVISALKSSSIGGLYAEGKPDAVNNPLLRELTYICTLCNESSVDYDSKSNSYVRVGEPTEVALRVLVEKIKTENGEFNKNLDNLNLHDRNEACNGYVESNFEKLATLEFSRDRKSMSVICKRATPANKASGLSFYVKGAPESILERCTKVRLQNNKTVPLDNTLRKRILEFMDYYGLKKTLRCLALAAVDDVKGKLSDYDLSDPKHYYNYEKNMTFVGLVGMSDPPRDEVKISIEKCKKAGIRVIVITGDNQNTAESVCRKIGIFSEKEKLTGKSFTGREWDQLSKEEKTRAALTASLFSRTEPTHKSELVDALQSLGFVVAMTGDGVNDAPALKKADIGVAMGSGTDVAKLASDMVLADDNFATIVSAVEEGRSIYNNTKQFIRYLISSNIGEVVSIFVTAAFGLPEALIPVQLLWVNLVTDGFPATALGFNPPDHDIMNLPPRTKTEPIVGKWLFVRYMIVGIYVGVATVFGYVWWFMFYDNGPKLSFNHLTQFSKCQSLYGSINGYSCATLFGEGSLMTKKASTMSLSVLVVIEMFNALNSLSENESILSLTPFSNPYLILAVVLSMTLHFCILYIPFLTSMFAITSLNWLEWQGVLLISFPVIVIDELLKIISRQFFAQDQSLHQVKHVSLEDLTEGEKKKA